MSPTNIIAVDLDGTLIKTDLLQETANQFLVENPMQSFMLFIWVSKGKGVLKLRLAELTQLDVTALPYNEHLLNWLRQEKAMGKRLVLATASHRLLADQIARHLDIFEKVLGTEGATNLKGVAKRDALISHYGEGRFDYVGNDWADMAIWRSAANAHIVSRSKNLIDQVRSQCKLGIILDDGKLPISKALLKAMRPHQWVKNFLVFIPLLAAYSSNAEINALPALLAFIAFSLTASSVYLLNDLVDVDDDRHHPRKCKRPFAAGHLELLHGWLAWPTLLVLAFLIAGLLLPWLFTGSLALYFSTTVAYSLRLKQVAIVDVMTLASLYTMRIIAGAAAVAVPLSFWLLSFSMFIFLSLALIKRFSELKAVQDPILSATLRGRGYGQQDLELVSSLGSSAGYISVLVLALYIQDIHTATLYNQPKLIWLACPLLLFWLSRAWIIAHRGLMHDDPIVFALKDRISWIVGTLLASVFVLAKVVN